MKLFTPRMTYFYSFLAIVFFMCFAYYLEKYDGLIPCPLCILQRVAMALLGILFFFGAILNLKTIGRMILAFLSLFVSLLGMFLAGRQVWLQHFPPDSRDDCGVSLHYLIRVLPPGEVIKKIFSGTAECAQKAWQFMGLSLAEWSLISFGIFAFFCLWQWKRTLNK